MKSNGITSGIRWLEEVLLIAALYVITGKLGFLLAIEPGNVTPVWAPSGLALAAILWRGNSIWPGIYLGSFLVNAWFFAEFTMSPWIALIMASNIAAGSTLQAVLGGAFVRRWIGDCCWFDKPPKIFKFAGIEIITCAVAPSFGVTTLFLGGFVDLSAYANVWWTWWLGDLIGTLVITPLVLVWICPTDFHWTARRGAEAVLLAALLLTTCELLFGLLGMEIPVAFLLLPFVVWAAVRFGSRGVMVTSFSICSMAILATLRGTGPFADEDLASALPMLQAFMGTFAMTGLVLAASIQQAQNFAGELLAALKEREKAQAEASTLAAIVQSSGDAIIGKTLDGFIVSWNDAAERIYGYSAEEAVGQSIALIFPVDRADELDTFMSRVRRGERIERFETERVRKDGNRIHVSLTISPIKDASGKIIGVSTIARDITERMRNQEALRLSEERFRAFMENSPAIAFIKDAAGRYVYINKTFETLLGRPIEALSGKTDYDVWPNETARQLRENDVAVLNANKSIQMFEILPAADAVPHHWMVYKFPIPDISGRRFLGGVAVDVTERRKLEAAREQLRVQYEAAIEKIKTLAGFLPICASCKKIRDDKGYWQQVEDYIAEHSEAEFSHGLCPDCARKLYPEYHKPQRGRGPLG